MIPVGIRRRYLRRLMVAKRTGDGGLQLHLHHGTSVSSNGSTKGRQTVATVQAGRRLETTENSSITSKLACASGST
jgi:hypothetical protein